MHLPDRASRCEDAKSRPLGAIVSALHLQHCAVSAHTVGLRGLLQSNSRPPHSFSAQPGAFVASCYECSVQFDAMAHSGASRSGNHKLYLILHKTTSSLRRIVTDMRTCICGFPSERETGSPSQTVRTSQQTQRNASRLHSLKADYCAIATPPPCLVEGSSVHR